MPNLARPVEAPCPRVPEVLSRPLSAFASGTGEGADAGTGKEGGEGEAPLTAQLRPTRCEHPVVEETVAGDDAATGGESAAL